VHRRVSRDEGKAGTLSGKIKATDATCQGVDGDSSYLITRVSLKIIAEDLPRTHTNRLEIWRVE
jgi:hypothetical protein